MLLVQMLLVALAAADWHRQAVGIPHDSVFLANSNETILVSSEFVSRIGPEGEIIWRQVHANQNPQVQAGKYVYVLNDNGILSAFNISNGAKEWAYSGVDSFAVDENHEVIVAANTQYTQLKPVIANGGRYLVNPTGWGSVPTGFDLQLHTCQSLPPMITKNSQFYFLNGTRASAACNTSKPELSVMNGVVSLKDRWSLHEGLANTTAACIIGNVHARDRTESWRQRVARHSAFRSLQKSDTENKQLLVVATAMGSLYALNAYTGAIMWADHHAVSPGTSLKADGEFAVLQNSTHKVRYSFNGSSFAQQDDSFALAKLGSMYGPSEVQGYTCETDGDAVYGYHNGTTTWTFRRQGWKIISVNQRGLLPSAVIATQISPIDYLYKYLNPNLVAVVSENSTNLEVLLIDGISGKQLGSVMHSKVDTQSLLACVVAENWIAYAINSKLYILQLYEANTPNKRNSNETESSFSDSLVPYLVEQSHQFRQDVSAIKEIHTNQGTGSGLLVGFPNSLEFIPQSEFNLGNYAISRILGSISKHAHVHGVRVLAASESRFESSVSVWATGTDIYHTQVAPLGVFDQLPTNFSYTGVLCSLFILTVLVYQLSASHMHATLQLQWA